MFGANINNITQPKPPTSEANTNQETTKNNTATSVAIQNTILPFLFDNTLQEKASIDKTQIRTQQAITIEIPASDIVVSDANDTVLRFILANPLTRHNLVIHKIQILEKF